MAERNRPSRPQPTPDEFIDELELLFKLIAVAKEIAQGAELGSDE